MKKNTINPNGANGFIWKFDLKMKLTTLFIFVTLLTMKANDTYSQNTKLSLDMKEVTVKDVIREIETLSDFKFLYNRKDVNLNRVVSVKAKKKRISSILNKVFSNTSTEFEVVNKQIVLRKKHEAPVIPPLIQSSVSGKVTDTNGTPLGGVNIVEKGTTNGTTSDFDGNYQITVAENATLVFSYIGFNTIEEQINGRSTIDIQLSEGLQLDDVVIVGSRNPNRVATETATAVDVIDVQNIVSKSGKIEINEILQYVAPSFNSNKQSGSDGADHIDPATLRGLGPDQTLVLINGKRRHSSSLVNLFGTRGRGNAGTDLNSIPAAAIKRIEILRDGAAAQYGSDAIAGVINIVLKNSVDGFTGSISYGAFNANAQGDFPDGTPNTPGNRLDTERDGNAIGDDQDFDGGSIKISGNYGVAVGKDGGYINATTEFISKNKTLRPGFNFRRGFGEAAIDGFNLFLNSSIPLSDKTEFYAFGGRNYRDTDAFAFTRNPDDARIVTSIFPNGFTPRITSIITDNSVSAGFRTELSSGWKVDISNTFGKNDFNYFIEGSLNASLEEASQSEFNAGGHSLSQNTVNLDVSKYYENVGSGLNLAFGAEYRTENFVIFPGELASFATFDVDGRPITDPSTQEVPIDPITGNPRPAGSQGFPGFSPANAVDKNRSNISLYADAELDVSESFLLAGATRFENYSDFGSTLNGKLAFRVKASDNFNVRGSVSTGFRAPSLVQLFYNLQFTAFVSGESQETLLSPNNSPVTQSFGIDRLEEETATNAALGITAKFGDFSATLDGYYISIRDRIVLTGRFPAPQIPNVNAAQFFVNGIDTESVGLDMVFSWKKTFNDGSFSATFAGNINNISITSINNGDLDAATFFGERDRSFLLASAPDSKFSFNTNYQKKWFSAGLGLTRFSEIVLTDFALTDDVYSPQIVTDLNFGFDLSNDLNLTVGGNNIFNAYPDQQNDGNTDSGGYWDAVQQGFGGAFYYARLGFTF